MSMSRSVKSALFFVIPLLDPVAVFADAPRTFGDVSMIALAILGQATLALMAAAVAIYFGNVAFSILKTNKGEAAGQRSVLLWGLLVIVVMVSIWGIIQILQNTLFDNAGSGAGGPRQQDACRNFGDAGCNLPIVN